MPKAIAELFVDVQGSMAKFQSEMAKGANALDKFGSKAVRFGASLSAISLPIAGIAGASLKMAGDFESSMNKVSARGDIFGSNLQKLNELAMKLGADTIFSAKQAADGMADLAAAGFNTTQIIAAMPGVLDFAAAAQMSVADSSHILADTLGQFGLKAESAGHVADVMTVAANASQISMEQLAQSMKFVGPNAAAMGVSLENITAMLSLLGEAGISADQAGTSLRMGFARLVAPGDKAAATLQRMGIEATDAAGKLKPLPELLNEFQQHASDPTFIGDMKTIFQTNSMTAWIAAAKLGGTELQRLQDLTNNAAGASQTQAEILRKGLNGALERMHGSVETLGIAFGKVLSPAAIMVAGGLEGIANKMAELVSLFDKAPESVKLVASSIVAIGAFAGPAAVGIGLLSMGFSALVPVLVAAQGALIALVATPLGPFLLVAGAVAVLGQQIYDHWNELPQIIGDLFRAFAGDSPVMKAGIEEIIKAWNDLGTTIVNSNFWEKSTFSAGLEALKTDFVGSMRVLMDGLDAFTGGWITTMKSWSDAVAGMVSAIEQQITGKLQSIFASIKAPIDQATAWFQGMYEAVVGHSFVPDMVTGIGQWMGKLNTLMTQPAQNATTAVTGSMAAMSSSVIASSGQMNQALVSVGEAFGLTGQQAQAAAKLVESFVSGLQSSQGFWTGFSQALSGQGGQGGAFGGGGTGGGYGAILGAGASYFGGGGATGPASAADGYYNPGGAPGSAGEGMGGMTYSYGDIVPAANDVAAMWQADYKKKYGAEANQQKAHDIAQRTGVAIASIFSFGLPALIYKALGKEKFTKLEHALDPIGQAVIDKLEKSMFGVNEATWARRQIARYLNKKVDAQALSNLPDAAPAKLNGNIDFGSSSRFNKPGWADSLNQDASGQAFKSVGEGLTNLLGVSKDVGAQIAKVLQEQLGGSLDNLRVYLQGLGVTAEDLTKVFVDQAEKGTISWHEMEVALQGVNAATGEGLAAVGDFGKAFDIIIQSGGEGMDAIMGLKDSAVEAGEAGFTSFSQWHDALIASGKDAGEVDAMFQALAQRGITTFDAIKGASNRDLGGVIADMESISKPLADMWHKAQTAAEDYAKAIGDIETPMNIELNVTANVSDSAQQVLDANEASKVTVPATKSQKFASGGVVNRATGFSFRGGLGLMGEAGPEAILPLTRVGGRLGVAAAGGMGNNGMVVHIDARNADAGTEARLRNLMMDVGDDIESRVLRRVMDEANRGGMFGNSVGN